MGCSLWSHQRVRQDLATRQQSFPTPDCIQDSFSFHFQDCNNCESWSGFLRFLSYLRPTLLLELVALYLWTNFGSFELLSLSTFLTPQSFSSDTSDTNINFLNNPKGSWASFNFYLGGSIFSLCLQWLILFFCIFCVACSFFCPLLCL